MFLNVGYVDKYTNLPATKDFHVSIYGVSGNSQYSGELVDI